MCCTSAAIQQSDHEVHMQGAEVALATRAKSPRAGAAARIGSHKLICVKLGHYLISEPGASREMEALGHVRSRACPGLPGPGPDGPVAVNSGVVSAVDRHARAAWALSWARLLCLQKKLVS